MRVTADGVVLTQHFDFDGRLRAVDATRTDGQRHEVRWTHGEADCFVGRPGCERKVVSLLKFKGRTLPWRVVVDTNRSQPDVTVRFKRFDAAFRRYYAEANR